MLPHEMAQVNLMKEMCKRNTFGGAPPCNVPNWFRNQRTLDISYLRKKNIAQMLHLWHIYPHLSQKWLSLVGKYASAMGHLGIYSWQTVCMYGL